MTQDSQTTARKPAFTAYVIPEREGAPWIAIGAAWPHKDGDGLNVRLDLTVTPNTRIVLRKPDAKAIAETAAGSEG